jgi:hypothetical protein
MSRTFNFGTAPIVMLSGTQEGRPALYLVERLPGAEGELGQTDVAMAQHLGVVLRMADIDAARQFRDMVTRAVYDLEVTLEREAEYARQAAIDEQAMAEERECVPTGHDPIEAEVIEETAPAQVIAKLKRARKAQTGEAVA